MRDKLDLLTDNQRKVQTLIDDIREAQENIRQNSMDTHDVVRKTAEDLRDLVDEREQVLIDEILDRESVKIQALTDQLAANFNEIGDMKRLHTETYTAVGQLKPTATKDQIKFLQLWAAADKHELAAEMDEIVDNFLCDDSAVTPVVEKHLPIWDTGLPLSNKSLPDMDFEENPEPEVKPQELPGALAAGLKCAIVSEAVAATQTRRDAIEAEKARRRALMDELDKLEDEVTEAEPAFTGAVKALAITKTKWKRTQQAVAQIEEAKAAEDEAESEFNEQIRELEEAQRKLEELKKAQAAKKLKKAQKAAAKAMNDPRDSDL